MKKLLLILLTLTMCISMCACNGNSSERDCEEAVQKLIDVCFYNKTSKKNMLSVAPENFWQRWADVEEDGNIDAVFAKFEDWSKDPKAIQRAKNTKVDYEMKYLTKLSKEECSRVEKALEKRDELNYSEIIDAFSFHLVLKVTDKNNETEEESCDAIAINMDGKWHIADYNDSRIRWLVDAYF